MEKAPLYGRFRYESSELLIQRLTQISTVALEGARFTAYILTQENEKRYGLNLQELEEILSDDESEINSLSASACSFSGKVVRINIRFNLNHHLLSGQYIISAQSHQRNLAIRDMLEGKWKGGPLPGPDYASAEPQPVIPPLRIRPKLTLPLAGVTYSRPTLTETDHFYFDVNSTPDTIMNLVNRLSLEYLDGAYFHLRMETVDGDYHLNMDRGELEFMFAYRREKILMLYMDAVSSDGQWVHIRLSYHPLLTGPNGEMDITSWQSDGIMNLIYDSIGTEGDDDAQPLMLQAHFHFSPSGFSLSSLIRLFNDISRDYLQRIPPVAFLSTHTGESYTGLSFYQLGKHFKYHRENIDVLSVGITQVVTGQTLSMMFQFTPAFGPPQGSVSMMWGDLRKHHAVSDLIWKRLGLEPLPED